MNNKIRLVPAPAVWDYRFKIFLAALFFSFCQVMPVSSQCVYHNIPFVHGEQLDYTIYFKWGILMPKAGEATFSYSPSSEGAEPGNTSRMLFRTTGMFESIFKMRDTLECYSDTTLLLLRGEKRANDGGYYSADKIWFSYDKGITTAKSLRYNLSRTIIDTTLVVDDGCALDMLGTILYVRSLDWENLKPGASFSVKVIIGRDIVNTNLNYKGPETISGKDNYKYNTHHFTIDIFDEAFSVEKSAADLWISNDANRIPVKIRAKLKIGAAEAYLRSASGTKSPVINRVKQ